MDPANLSTTYPLGCAQSWLAAAMDAICYGDTVELHDDAFRGRLQGEGHRDARLWLSAGASVGDTDGCTFEIFPMLQYAARRELVLVTAGAAGGVGGSDAAVAQLRARAAEEASANAQQVVVGGSA